MSYSIATSILLLVYAVFTIIIVYRGAKKTKNLQDFALGNGFSPVVVGLSLAAGITSAATFIINPGFVAFFGWSAFLAMSVVLPIGLFLSLIVLSKSFRKYGAHIKALTLAQWVGKRYDSPFYTRLMSFFSLLIITFIVLICVGLTKVIAGALGTSELLTLIGIVVFVFGYIMFGGANSMIYTNVIQAILMLIVTVIILFSGIDYFSNGIESFYQNLENIDPNLLKNYNPNSPLFRDWFEVVFCNFIVGVAIVCQPHIITRSLMLKSEKDINKYLLVAILAETVFFLVLLAGFYARIMFPDLKNDGNPIKMDGILTLYVVKKFTVGVGIIVILGLISAGLSTLEGLVQSLSTTITNDIIAPIQNIDDQKRLNFINKIVIIILGILAIFISYFQLISPNLSVGILAQNGVYAYFSAAFVPVLFGIFVKDTPKVAAITASIVAIIVHFSIYYGQLTPYTNGAVRNPAVASCIAIISSVLIGLLILGYYRINKNKPQLEK